MLPPQSQHVATADPETGSIEATDGPAPVPPYRRRGVVIAAALVVAVVLASVLTSCLVGGDPQAPTQAAPSPSPSATPLTTAEIYQAMLPSVVVIEAAGVGTGVVANADGVILTANHVVAGATSIKLTFADGTVSAASVLSADPAMDIAALAPDTLPAVVVPAVLGGRLNVGDGVVAIGNQLGLAYSTTSGVVSGLDRSAPSRDGSSLSGLIQFDAAVNPGSSGGPLVNARGETVGIVVALANPTPAGTFIGIGFAVPIGAAVSSGRGGQGPQQ